MARQRNFRKRKNVCRTFQKWKMNCRRAANVFSFSKIPLPRHQEKDLSSSCWMKGQTRPGIQDSQEFAHHVEGIAGSAPPMPGIKGIGGGSAHNGWGLS